MNVLTIEDLQKLVRLARDVLGPSAIIAGDAVRDTLHGRPVKGIDIFVRVAKEDVTPQTGDFSCIEAFQAGHCRFREWAQALCYELTKAYPGSEIALTQQVHPENASGGELADLVNITGLQPWGIPVQIIGIYEDPVDDVQNYDFALSQCFVTPSGLFYTERYLGDANGLTVTYVGDADVGSNRFWRSVNRLARLREKYAPEFRFVDCDLLDKVASDASL